MEWIGDLERAFAASIYPNRGWVAVLAAVALSALLLHARRYGWFAVAKRHGRVTATLAAVALAVASPVAWYLGAPLFVSTMVDEPPPALGAVATGAAPTRDPSPSRSPDSRSLGADSTATPTPELLMRSGSFAGADEFHFGRGSARVIETSPGSYTLRLEGFAVRNGPDLYVYLSPSADGYAPGALEVAPLKADRGNQNYAIPATTDLSGMRSVVIWCKQFGVLFATAPLS